MRGRIVVIVGVALFSMAIWVSSSLADAANMPVWKLHPSSEPTYFTPSSKGADSYLVVATNVGSKTTNGEVTLTDTLPPGVEPLEGETGATSNDQGAGAFACSVLLQVVTCEGSGPVHPGYSVWAQIPVQVGSLPEETVLTNSATMSGGEAATAAVSTPTTISSSSPSFDFLPGERGLRAPVIDKEGEAVTEAGSHQAFEQIVDLGFPTIAPDGLFTGSGHVRDVKVDLPRGVLGNPSATPVRCTEAELTAQSPGCPDASQIGTVTITTVAVAALGPKTSPLYNMVPPPGAPAAFGFDALGVGIFPHVLATIRSESDYGASGISNDILARGLNPILDVSAELWGDPSAKEHDFVRGSCLFNFGPPRACEVESQDEAFLFQPVDCPGGSLEFGASADSWEQPDVTKAASYHSATLSGAPTQVGGCDQLEFEPSIAVKPTTNVTESPSGLDVEVRQPQKLGLLDRSTAILRDATVALPKGLEINASQADGLASCSAAEIGLLGSVGELPAHFSKAPASCPSASKLGTVEVTSPLLAQYNAQNEVERDPETGRPIPEPLHGSVFVATPFENPFKSLFAIYLTVEDPAKGIFAKLPVKVEPDPVTGQLTARLEESPELPLETAKVHLFTGSRAPLQTPLTCGPHATSTAIVPWGAPEAPSASPGSSFSNTAAPGGGPCVSEEGNAPNAPRLVAATVTPAAGAYSPLALRLTREDGSQRMEKIETTFPPGLTGKLVGIAQCSDADIARAQSRSRPNEGTLEISSPSCPADSQVGSVDVAAGAGPSPFHIAGHLYMAGPYKGAPLSLVAITPAVAGPFDLGSVVVRIAVSLDPVSGQIRAVSDPFPRILQGIPVDVRSVTVRTDRPSFTLNPTSCEPSAFTGTVTSIFDQPATIGDSFQVGGCRSLKYAPSLTARLFGPIHRGGHPRFRSIFTARAGDANTARIVFALPRSEFIDQAHFRTICTRVQFQADQCPPGAVYGHIRAFSPLVDYPVEGPIYLRSSNHELPDVVGVLKGPPSQPVEVDLDGRVDSINGGVRTTFAAVPDLPVSKAIVTLQGAKKGLFQNSTNICKGDLRATVKLTAQNGAIRTLRPKMKADCPKKSAKKVQVGHRK
jgi:hypothetical protein